MSRLIEKIIEKGLFASRWVMAPFYIGLVGALVVLLFSFMQDCPRGALPEFNESSAPKIAADCDNIFIRKVYGI
jgi:uncharacterized protein (TIGR00645 family)